MKYCNQLDKDGKVCHKTASYGLIDEGEAKFCSPCSKNIRGKIVNYKHGFCIEIINDKGKLQSERLCGENANFNFIDAKIKKGVRCCKHKIENMICINGHLCKQCKIKQATFILPDSNKKSPTHCLECLNENINKENVKMNIKENMKADIEEDLKMDLKRNVKMDLKADLEEDLKININSNINNKEKIKNIKYDVCHKKCIECKLSTATFGLKDSKIKEYCKTCIDKLNLKGIDLVHKKCAKCEKHATYNFEGNKPLYCGEHSEEGMIEIYANFCIKCKVVKAYFNIAESNKAEYCKKCSEEGMINIKETRSCKGCNLQRPSFNFFGEKDALYCSKCKLEGMININYEICIEKGCNQNSYYNYENLDIPTYCKTHKKENMINIYSKKCINCIKYPTFGYKDERQLYCQEHKLDSMIDLKHLLCVICNEKRAIFNEYGNNNPLYCIDHKTDSMINTEHSLCIIYMCGRRKIEKYDNHCMTCYINLYPEKPISRNFKTKEGNVIQYILGKYLNFSWISDKKIKDGCSLKRPDLLLDLGYQVINIEIDENQHKSYEEICENKRLMTISKDIHHRNLILIRFNPDGYTKNNIKYPTCWTVNKDGLHTIKKTYKNEWKNRLKELSDCIEHWINPKNVSDKMIHIINLFFDE